jgi:hypothetical protein
MVQPFFFCASNHSRARLGQGLSRLWLAALRGGEVAVLDAGGFGPTDVGMPLMPKAFDKTSGPLSKKTDPEPEREVLATSSPERSDRTKTRIPAEP